MSCAVPVAREEKVTSTWVPFTTGGFQITTPALALFPSAPSNAIKPPPELAVGARVGAFVGEREGASEKVGAAVGVGLILSSAGPAPARPADAAAISRMARVLYAGAARGRVGGGGGGALTERPRGAASGRAHSHR
jgi:hypothetical protein